MLHLISGLISAWPLVVRRSLAHWRLLSSVVVGVLLASAIMSGTVIYFNSLRGLALKSTLAKLTTNETNIIVQADRGPTSFEEYEKVRREVEEEIHVRAAWMVGDRARGGKSATFYVTVPGNEDMAGEDDARSYFAFLPQIQEYTTLLPGGRLPAESAVTLPGESLALEAMVPVEAAELFGVGVGDELSVVPYWEDVIPQARVIITGIFEMDDPSDEFWHMFETVFQASTSSEFRTIPFFLPEQAFMEGLGGAFRDLDSTYSWLLSVETDRINSTNATAAHANLRLMERRLATSLNRYRQITGLEDSLADYDQRLFFAKLPMFVVLILIAVVILYYVVTLSSMLVEQQRGELALLRSRGASSAQILAVFVLEGATISTLAIVVGPLLAAVVISFLGYTPAFSELSGGDRLPVMITRGAYLMSALGGGLSFAALVIPAVQASRVGVTRQRQEAARPSNQPFFQRYYLDVLLLAISVLLFQQLSEQGSVVAVGLFGDVGESRLLLALPALILVALAMVMLRLFPLSISFLSGDSPTLLHLVVGGAVAILLPSIVANGVANESGLAWLGQAALMATLGGAYWATHRLRNTYAFWAGLAVQAGLVASVILVGPTLPNDALFIPLLAAIVPAQLVFVALKSTMHRAPVGLSLGLWQMARNPTHYARLSLLLILMAGLGIFAASFGGTLRRSFKERALYATGSDIRLEGIRLNSNGATRPFKESYDDVPGVGQASPAFRGYGTDLSKLLGEGLTMFAVESNDFGQIAWYRDDFSDKSLNELLDSLGTANLPEGIELPTDAASIGVTLKADRPHRTIAVTARLKDANGRYFTYWMGTLESSDWLEFETSLERVSRYSRRYTPLQPLHPMSLISLSIHESDGERRLRSGWISIAEVHATTANGEVRPLESFDDLSKWSILRTAGASISDVLEPSELVFDGDTGAAKFIWSEGLALISRGIFLGPPISPLPVVASKSFLKGSGHALGDEFEITASGHRVPIRLVDSIDYFPTLETTRKRGFLIADLTSLSTYANLDTTTGEFKPNEVWLSTDLQGPEREQLLDSIEEDTFSATRVHDRAESLASSKVDPLVEAGWSALLFIAFSAVLILSSMGFLVHAYVSFRDREPQFALMRTMGFSLRQLMMLVWLEQALVIVAGLALGTWIGREISAVIMPFLGHDDRGSQVLPPFKIEIGWGSLAITYAAMALVFVLIIVGVIWFVRRISLQRILRLGDT